MENRSKGFLWNPERDLIDAYTGKPDGERGPALVHSETNEPNSLIEHRKKSRLDEIDQPASTKSRVKSGPASPEGLGDILRAINRDLTRVENFWSFVEDQPEGRRQWQNVILPANERELRSLHTLLTSWLHTIEADSTQEDTEVDQEYIERVLEPIAVNQPEEQRARTEALTLLLSDDELREILEEIQQNPNTKLPKNEPYGNITWRQAASSKLRNELGVIENLGDFDHVYHLTDRGEAICEVLDRIENSSIFENLETEVQKERWIRAIATGSGLP